MPPNQKRFILFLLLIVSAILLAHALYPDSPVFTAFNSAGQDGASALTASAVASTSSTGPYLSSVDGVSGGDQVTQATGSTIAASPFSLTGNAVPPRLSDKVDLIADLESGATFYSVNPGMRWPTASLTKLMTATVVLDTIPTSTRITITPQMFAADPTEQNLVVGGSYTVEDLLHLLLMPSSNVAAEAMADFYGRTQFMALMNQRAKSWGMNNTYFDDPSGISAANESSADDLMTLAQHIYQNYPEILALTDTPSYTYTELNSGKRYTISSINIFAGEPDFIGGKTGNTPQAAGNLLSVFTYEGHPILVIVLGGPVLPFGDTSRLYQWFRENYSTT